MLRRQLIQIDIFIHMLMQDSCSVSRRRLQLGIPYCFIGRWILVSRTNLESWDDDRLVCETYDSGKDAQISNASKQVMDLRLARAGKMVVNGLYGFSMSV